MNRSNATSLSVTSNREEDSNRKQEEHGNHGERQGAVLGEKTCCRSKALADVKDTRARRNPLECRLKPRRHGAEIRTEQTQSASQCHHPGDGHGSGRGFGSFQPRATLRNPPNPSGIGYDRVRTDFNAAFVNCSSDCSHVGADSADCNMRSQIGIGPLGPAGAENGSQNFSFELTFYRLHYLPLSPALLNKAASLRRARNSMVFKLPGLRPSTDAISECEAPSA